jgi:ABC-type uncharacterized transport system involved in gliding motility auxiliary subunit
MQKFKRLFTTSGGVGLLVIAVLAINVISSKLYVRADLTSEKIYSLSEGSAKIIDKLQNDVTVQLYFSKSSGELPVAIKTYASRVEELLNEYAGLSSGKISVEVLDPKADSDEEVWARRYGISSVRLPSGNELYFGIALLYGGKDVAIPYLDPRREEFLEYDISEALLQTQSSDKIKVGIYSSLPVISAVAPSPMVPQRGPKTWAFVEQLKKYVDVESVSDTVSEIDSDIKVLMILHPKAIVDKFAYAIDQFLLRGGRLIVAVDPFSRVELSLKGQMGMMNQKIPDVGSDFEKFFRAWGIEYNRNEILGDLQYSAQVNAGGQVVPYPFWMNMGKGAFSDQSAISSKLSQVLFGEGGAVKLKAEQPLKFEALVKTTKQSGFAPASLASIMGARDFAGQLKVDNQSKAIVGLLTGKFKSAFAKGKPSGNESAAPHIAEAAEPGAVLIIADTDFMHDSNAVSRIQFGPQVILRPRNDNLNLIYNGVEFLGGSDDLISIRSRGRLARPFTTVQELQAKAQERYQKEEQSLSKEINELQKKLTEMQQQRSSGSRFSLQATQITEIEKFRVKEKEARERRREVRKGLREDIESLGKKLIAVNMLIMPLMIGGLGVVVFGRRNRRSKR